MVDPCPLVNPGEMLRIGVKARNCNQDAAAANLKSLAATRLLEPPRADMLIVEVYVRSVPLADT